MSQKILDFAQFKLAEPYTPATDTTITVIAVSERYDLTLQRQGGTLTNFRFTVVEKEDTTQFFRIKINDVASTTVVGGKNQYILNIQESNLTNIMIGLANDDDGTNDNANIIAGNLDDLTISTFSKGSSVALVVGTGEYNELLSTFVATTSEETQTVGEAIDTTSTPIGVSLHTDGKYYKYNNVSGAIISVADNGSGFAQFTSTAHGLANETTIDLTGMSESTYNVIALISAVTANTFDVVAIAFVATDTGNFSGFTNLQGVMKVGQNLVADATGTLINLKGVSTGYTGLTPGAIAYVENLGVVTNTASSTTAILGDTRSATVVNHGIVVLPPELSKSEVEDETSIKFGQVSGERLAQSQQGSTASYGESKGGTASISAVADDGSGKAEFTSTAHDLENGRTVVLSGFSEGTYNVTGVVSGVTANTFIVTTITFVATGTGAYTATDAYLVTLVPAAAAYFKGMKIVLEADITNTGAATLNVNGLGTKDIRKNKDSVLEDGDIQSGQFISMIYDGVNFQMVSIGRNTAKQPVEKVVMRKNADQTISSGFEIATFTTETTDVDSEYASSIYTANGAGWRRFTWMLSINTTSARPLYQVRKNGTAVLKVSGGRTSNTENAQATIVWEGQLSDTDTVDLYISDIGTSVQLNGLISNDSGSSLQVIRYE